MREIKFRAWDKSNNVMVMASSKKFLVIDTTNTLSDTAQEDNYILMQYTGLKDKNGVEIYEGDIIKASGEYPAEIIFNFGTFLLRHLNHVGKNGVSISDVATDRYEVIGNIYNNPELFK